MTTSLELAEAIAHKCTASKDGHEHHVIDGSRTAGTGRYPPLLCKQYARIAMQAEKGCGAPGRRKLIGRPGALRRPSTS